MKPKLTVKPEFDELGGRIGQPRPEYGICTTCKEPSGHRNWFCCEEHTPPSSKQRRLDDIRQFELDVRSGKLKCDEEVLLYMRVSEMVN